MMMMMVLGGSGELSKHVMAIDVVVRIQGELNLCDYVCGLVGIE